jgi:hypothetical protein
LTSEKDPGTTFELPERVDDDRLLELLSLIHDENQKIGTETYQFTVDQALEKFNSKLQEKGMKSINISTLYNYLKRLRRDGIVVPESRTVEIYHKISIPGPEQSSFPSFYAVDNEVPVKPVDMAREDHVFEVRGEITLKKHELTGKGKAVLKSWRESR